MKTQLIAKTQNSVKTMSSREIAQITEKLHKHVKRDIEVMLKALHVDQSKFGHIYVDKQNRSQTEYLLPRRECEILITGYDITRRAKVIDRWLELETEKQENQQFVIPSNFSEALMLAAEQARQLELARPAVEFIEKYVDSSGLMTFREAAQILNAQEKEFRNFLVNNKIMYKLNGTWTAYKAHTIKGYFDVKTGANADGRAFKATFFTANGINWITQKWESKDMVIQESKKMVPLSLTIIMNSEKQLIIMVRDPRGGFDKRLKNVTEKMAVEFINCGFYSINVHLTEKAFNSGLTFADYYIYPDLLKALTA